MVNKQIIESLISEGKVKEAIDSLSANIQQEPSNAEWLFMRGKLYWKEGDRKNAITDFETAVAIDPSSPAKNALQMTRDIMDYFTPDMFNP